MKEAQSHFTTTRGSLPVHGRFFLSVLVSTWRMLQPKTRPQARSRASHLSTSRPVLCLSPPVAQRSWWREQAHPYSYASMIPASACSRKGRTPLYSGGTDPGAELPGYANHVCKQNTGLSGELSESTSVLRRGTVAGCGKPEEVLPFQRKSILTTRRGRLSMQKRRNIYQR